MCVYASLSLSAQTEQDIITEAMQIHEYSSITANTENNCWNPAHNLAFFSFLP